jgi:hypothetical protein
MNNAAWKSLCIELPSPAYPQTHEQRLHGLPLYESTFSGSATNIHPRNRLHKQQCMSCRSRREHSSVSIGVWTSMITLIKSVKRYPGTSCFIQVSRSNLALQATVVLQQNTVGHMIVSHWTGTCDQSDYRWGRTPLVRLTWFFHTENVFSNQDLARTSSNILVRT